MTEHGGVLARFILIFAALFIAIGLLLAWCADDDDRAGPRPDVALVDT